MEAAAFWKSRGFDVPAAKGDAGFDEIMLKWLGAAKGHPSYWDRWALYRAMINKLPRPFVVPEGGIQATQKQKDKRAGCRTSTAPRPPTTRRERLEDTMTIPVDTPEGRLAAIVYARVLGDRETLNELARDLPLVHLGSPDELQAAP